MSVNPKTLVEKFIKDSKGRSRLAAATSVLAVFTVLITVGVLTFPAISISGSDEALREQGIDITAGQTNEAQEVVAPPADEAPIVAYDEASQAPDAESVENVAEAITEETTIGDVVVSEEAAPAPAEGELAADAPAEGEATDVEAEGETEAEAEEELDPEKAEAEEKVEASDAAKAALATADLSSQRLIVGTSNADALAEETNVVANFDNIYLLQYASVEEAAEGFLSYFDIADYVTPDVAVEVADDLVEDNSDPEEEIITTDNVYTEETNPFVELEVAIEENQAEIEAEATKQDALIAVIDTGAALEGNVIESVSMLGENGADDNGHGQRMVDYVVEENENARILSIKALGADGKGDVSAVVAGIDYAITRGANIINLSASAYASEENVALVEAVKRAEEAGIIVVGSAGNNGFNAKFYIPGNIAEATIVGSADAEGNRIARSNFGETVDYNVVSDSTSEAAARMTGFISANGEGAIADVLNQGLIFETGYVAPEPVVEEEEESEEEPAEEQDARLEAATQTVNSWAALKAAIESGETDIVIPQGTTITNDGSITIPTGTTVTIRGGGVIKANGSFEQMFWVKGGSLTLKNLTFDGAGGSHTSDVGFFVTADAGNLTLTGSTFKNVASSGNNAAPIYVRDRNGAANLTVTNCNFNNNNMSGSNSAGAIVVSGSTTTASISGGSMNNNTAMNAIVRAEDSARITSFSGTTLDSNSITGEIAAPVVVKTSAIVDDISNVTIKYNKTKYFSTKYLEEKGGKISQPTNRDEVEALWNTGYGMPYLQQGTDYSYSRHALYDPWWSRYGDPSAGGNGRSNPAKGSQTAGAILVDNGLVNMSSGVFNHNYGDIGAVYVRGGGSFTQTGGQMKNNYGHNGGAVTIVNGSYVLNGGELNNNRSWWLGGAVSVFDQNSSFVMDGNASIHHNDTLFKGGGVFTDSDNTHLVSGDIYNNSALVFGGGIYQDDGSYMALESTAVYHNNTGNAGGYNNWRSYASYEQGHGGGVWMCSTGRIEFDTSQAHIWGNDAYNGGQKPGKDLYLNTQDRGGKLYSFTVDSRDNWHWEYNSGAAGGSYSPSKILSDSESLNISATNKDVTYNLSDHALRIYDNWAPNGGGIGTNGYLTFGRKAEMSVNASLSLQKNWASGATPKDIRVTVTFLDANGKAFRTVSEELTASQNTMSIALPDVTITDGDSAISIYERIAGLTASEHRLSEFDIDGKVGFSGWSLRITEEVKENGVYLPAEEDYTIAVGDLYGSAVIEKTYDTNSNGHNMVAAVTTKTINLRTTLTNIEKKYQVPMKKTDSETNEGLPNAVFSLKRASDNKYATVVNGKVGTWVNAKGNNTAWRSDANGDILFADLQPGVYYIEETSAPNGYSLLEEPIRFEIDGYGNILAEEVSTVNTGAVTIDGGKLSINGQPVTVDGSEVYIQTKAGESTNQLTAGHTYIIGTEANKDCDYIWGHNNTLGFRNDGGYRYVNATWDYDWQGLSMQWVADIINGEPVLYNRESKKYLVYDNGFKFVNRGEVAKGGLSVVTVENTKTATDLYIYKVGQDGRQLPGATFTLYKSNGSIAKTGISDADGKIQFKEILPGNYYFMETGVPEGYNGFVGKIAVNVTSAGASLVDKDQYGARPALDSDGTLLLDGHRVYVDAAGTVNVSGGTPLKLQKKSGNDFVDVDQLTDSDIGTVFFITDGNGNYMQNRTFDASLNEDRTRVRLLPRYYKNQDMTARGDFEFKYARTVDTKTLVLRCNGVTDGGAPESFLYFDGEEVRSITNGNGNTRWFLSESRTVTADTDENGFTVTVKNEKNKHSVKVIKTDSATDEQLTGATFSLYKITNANAKELIQTVASTSSNPLSEFAFNGANGEGLEPGMYVLEEDSAPEHYTKYEHPIYFTIATDGAITLLQSSGVASVANGNKLTIDGMKLYMNSELPEATESTYLNSGLSNSVTESGVDALTVCDPNGDPVSSISATGLYKLRDQNNKYLRSWANGKTVTLATLGNNNVFVWKAVARDYGVVLVPSWNAAEDLQLTIKDGKALLINKDEAVYAGTDAVSLADGTINLTVANEPFGWIEVIKKDENNSAVAGATLQIKDAKGQLATLKDADNNTLANPWVTTTTSTKILLPAGQYTLEEIAAPSTHVGASVVSFEVEAGRVYSNPIPVEMLDLTKPEESVTVYKIEKDETGAKHAVKGATLEIQNVDGSLAKRDDGTTIQPWVTTGDPHVITGIVPGTYKVVETNAPVGYVNNGASEDLVVLDKPNWMKDYGFNLSTAPITSKQFNYIDFWYGVTSGSNTVAVPSSKYPWHTVGNSGQRNITYCIDSTNHGETPTTYNNNEDTIIKYKSDNLDNFVNNIHTTSEVFKTNIVNNRDYILKALWLGYPNDAANIMSTTFTTGTQEDKEINFYLLTQAVIWHYTNGDIFDYSSTFYSRVSDFIDKPAFNNMIALIEGDKYPVPEEFNPSIFNLVSRGNYNQPVYNQPLIETYWAPHSYEVELENVRESGTVKVDKKWVESDGTTIIDGNDSGLPGSIEVTLRRYTKGDDPSTAEDVITKTLTKPDWTVTFDKDAQGNDLPYVNYDRYDSATNSYAPYIYSIKEVNPGTGFTAETPVELTSGDYPVYANPNEADANKKVKKDIAFELTNRAIPYDFTLLKYDDAYTTTISSVSALEVGKTYMFFYNPTGSEQRVVFSDDSVSSLLGTSTSLSADNSRKWVAEAGETGYIKLRNVANGAYLHVDSYGAANATYGASNFVLQNGYLVAKNGYALAVQPDGSLLAVTPGSAPANMIKVIASVIGGNSSGNTSESASASVAGIPGLQGAKFTLKDTTADKFVNATGEFSNSGVELSTDQNGKLHVTGLQRNHEYVLTETKAPDHYVTPTGGTISFYLNEFGKVIYRNSNNITVVTATEDDVDLAASNTLKTFDLPATGGIGTHLFVIAGVILMLVAGALFVRRASRERS